MRPQGEASTDVGGSHSCPPIGAIWGQMNCRFQVQPVDSVAWGHAADRNAILSSCHPVCPKPETIRAALPSLPFHVGELRKSAQ
jgi:hypothetical protein